MVEKTILTEPAAEAVGKTLVEEFMSMCYEFRRNVISDKYEMRECCNTENAAVTPMPWRVVTRESQNTIIRRAKRELGEDMTGLKACIEEYRIC